MFWFVANAGFVELVNPIISSPWISHVRIIRISRYHPISYVLICRQCWIRRTCQSYSSPWIFANRNHIVAQKLMSSMGLYVIQKADSISTEWWWWCQWGSASKADTSFDYTMMFLFLYPTKFYFCTTMVVSCDADSRRPRSLDQELIPNAKEPAWHQPMATYIAGPNVCSLGWRDCQQAFKWPDLHSTFW